MSTRICTWFEVYRYYLFVKRSGEISAFGRSVAFFSTKRLAQNFGKKNGWIYYETQDFFGYDFSDPIKGFTVVEHHVLVSAHDATFGKVAGLDISARLRV